MSLSETRFGANATGLPGPAPLPPLAAALSRRAALFAAVRVSVDPAALHAVPADTDRRGEEGQLRWATGGHHDCEHDEWHGDDVWMFDRSRRKVSHA